MEIQRGQIVFSRAGRDITAVYAIVDHKQDRVLLANGQKWTLAAPKPKNHRHIIATTTVLPAEAMETDTTLSLALEGYLSSLGPEMQGG